MHGRRSSPYRLYKRKMHGRRFRACSLYKMLKRRSWKMPGHRSGTCKSSDRFGARKMPEPRTSEMPEPKCGTRKMHKHRAGPSKIPRHRTGPYKMRRRRRGPYKMPSHRGSRQASVGAIRPRQMGTGNRG